MEEKGSKSKETLKKISEIIDKCREVSGIEDEKILGDRFYELLDSSDDLIDLIHKLIMK